MVLNYSSQTEDDKVIGGVISLYNPFASFIFHLCVDPRYQNQGIGTKLLNSIVSKVDHHLRVILYAEPGKDKFYKNNNFHTMKTAMMTSNKLPLELGRKIGFIE